MLMVQVAGKAVGSGDRAVPRCLTGRAGLRYAEPPYLPCPGGPLEEEGPACVHLARPERHLDECWVEIKRMRPSGRLCAEHGIYRHHRELTYWLCLMRED